jgi:lysophospholipase L1-like esterase
VVRLLVLGDSCSAGLGPAQAVYPSVLHRLLGGDHRIENHAVPGFTSADAARYYRRALAGRRWDVVIVYLGNTDASRSVYKGTYRRWLDTTRRGAERGPVLFTPVERGDRILFSDRPEESDVATTPRDFRANVESIVRIAGRRGSRVIVVNPIANRGFPAALMGATGPFFSMVGLRTAVAGRLAGTTDRSRALVAALAAHEGGRLDDAARQYRALLHRSDPVRSIAANNLAVMLDESVGGEEPLSLAKDLADSPGAAGAVAAHNLGRMLSARGRHDEAEDYATQAAERDINLYRVKSAYRAELAALSRHSHVDVVDLAAVLTAADFVDYCHPTPSAHRAIASVIRPLVQLLPAAGTAEPDGGYVCVHPSPNASLDFPATMLAHFAIDQDVDGAEVHKAASALLDDGEELDRPAVDQGVRAGVRNLFRFAAGHPLVTSRDDLRARLPEHGWEVGRFPELYFDRLLRDYAHAAEQWGVAELPDAVRGQWPLDSTRYQHRLLPGLTVPPPRVPVTDPEHARRILAKVRAQLAEKREIFSDCRADRIVTVKYWYLREAFRFGAHSRPGMCYPEWEMEKIVEGLFCALVIARRHGDVTTETHALALLDTMARLRAVHEKYATREPGGADDTAEYRTQLALLEEIGESETAP